MGLNRAGQRPNCILRPIHPTAAAALSPSCPSSISDLSTSPPPLPSLPSPSHFHLRPFNLTAAAALFPPGMPLPSPTVRPWRPPRLRPRRWVWGTLPSGLQTIPRDMTYDPRTNKINYAPVEEMESLRTKSLGSLGPETTPTALPASSVRIAPSFAVALVPPFAIAVFAVFGLRAATRLSREPWTVGCTLAGHPVPPRRRIAHGENRARRMADRAIEAHG